MHRRSWSTSTPMPRDRSNASWPPNVRFSPTTPRGLPTCILERVHLGMKHGARALNAPVVSTADDSPCVHQNGSDRNAAFLETPSGFVYRREKEVIRHMKWKVE